MNLTEAEELHISAGIAETKRRDDVELIIDIREVLGRAQGEIARLYVRNRELEGQLSESKANLLKAERARDAAELVQHKLYMARQRKEM